MRIALDVVADILATVATAPPWRVRGNTRSRDVVDVDGNLIANDVGDDAPLLAAAPDLAADLLDAHAALDAHRTRADAAEAECDYWREQMTAAAPCVDEIRRLTRRVVRGGTGCALDPVLAVDTAIATLDGMMVSIERIASVRDAERARCAAVCRAVAARYRGGACPCEECEGRCDGARECADAIERGL